MASNDLPFIVLFGYDSSPFTQKIRLALAVRQIPYTFILVPSMMPRPILREHFNLTYRKIPVLAINQDLYIDTSLILEVIATHESFTDLKKHPGLYPPNDTRTRTLTRLLSSHYTDRPLFRLTTGLIPRTVWETTFGHDRAGLIGHKLDPNKLGAKLPRNLSGLDTHLSILEPLFAGNKGWFLDTDKPSAADISLYYQLDWGDKISRGEGIHDLTGGGTADGHGDGIKSVFNRQRYPGLTSWFDRARSYFETLPNVETRIERTQTKKIEDVLSRLNKATSVTASDDKILTLRTSSENPAALDANVGLRPGIEVSVAPDDTGRDDPTVGTLLAASAEEIVIRPALIEGRESRVKGVRVHFPRIGFVVKSLGMAKL